MPTQRMLNGTRVHAASPVGAVSVCGCSFSPEAQNHAFCARGVKRVPWGGKRAPASKPKVLPAVPAIRVAIDIDQ